MDTTLSLQLHTEYAKFRSSSCPIHKGVLLHCIAFPILYQRMTVTVAHARLNCVCTVYRYRSHYSLPLSSNDSESESS